MIGLSLWATVGYYAFKLISGLLIVASIPLLAIFVMYMGNKSWTKYE